MTDDREEWGPWIEHDGKGCPIPKGTFGEAKLRNGNVVPFVALCGSTIGGPEVRHNECAGSAWVWGGKAMRWRFHEVLEYRTRKPRALRQLREMVDNLPAPERERETT